MPLTLVSHTRTRWLCACERVCVVVSVVCPVPVINHTFVKKLLVPVCVSRGVPPGGSNDLEKKKLSVVCPVFVARNHHV